MCLNILFSDCLPHVASKCSLGTAQRKGIKHSNLCRYYLSFAIYRPHCYVILVVDRCCLHAGCMVLPSTLGDEAPTAFARLLATAPPFLQQAVREGRAITHHICLHDVSRSPSTALETAKNVVASLGSAIGPAGHVITMNSPSMPKADPRVWEGILQERVTDDSIEKAISSSRINDVAHNISCSDVVSVKTAVEELAVRKVALFIESRIRLLDTTALASRRGIRNQLRSFLFRKSSSYLTSDGETNAAKSTLQGAHNSWNSRGRIDLGFDRHVSAEQYELRQLVDLLLMVGDFETALLTLRLLAIDFKGEKCYFDYASIQETLAMVTVLSDGVPADAVANFKEAYYRYNQVAMQMSQQGNFRIITYATRAALLTSEYLAAISRFSDASWILVKAHFQEEDLRGALLLERAAEFLLRTEPPRVRKHAFHLVLAGLRYSKAEIGVLACRVYENVLEVYRDQGWDLIEEHVREALAKHFLDTGDAIAAAQQFISAFSLFHLPPHRQSVQLENSLEALAALNSKVDPSLFLSLSVPHVSGEKAKISSPGQFVFAGQCVDTISAETWKVLENCCINHSTDSGEDSSKPHSLGGSMVNLQAFDASSCCVGEDIIVEVDVHNVLGIAVEMTNLRLDCTWKSSSTPAPEVIRPSHTEMNDEFFILEEQKVSLDAGARNTIRLKTKPLKIGYLCIKSLSWVMNGIPGGRADLAHCRKEQGSKQSSGSSNYAYTSEETGILVKVIEPMPCLDVTIEGLPLSLLAGQVVQCKLRIKNIGAIRLRNLRASTDSSNIYISSETSNISVRRHEKFNGVITFAWMGASAMLDVGETVYVPLFVRPSSAGPLIFNLCWYYEADAVGSLPYRILHTSHSVDVLPSLALVHRIEAAKGNEIGNLVLEQDVSNLHGDLEFQLDTFELMSANWTMRPSSVTKEDGSTRGESLLNLGFRVKPQRHVRIYSILFPVESELEESSLSSAAEQHFLIGQASLLSGMPLMSGLLRWKALDASSGSIVADGFECLRIMDGTRDNGVDAEIILSKRTIRHDFEKDPCCFVEMQLTIANRTIFPLQVKWGTPSRRQTRSKVVGQEFQTLCGVPYSWCGMTSGSVSTLNAGEKHSVGLCVLVLNHGWIEIDGCWIAWKKKSDEGLVGSLEQNGSMHVPSCHFYVGNKTL